MTFWVTLLTREKQLVTCTLVLLVLDFYRSDFILIFLRSVYWFPFFFSLSVSHFNTQKQLSSCLVNRKCVNESFRTRLALSCRHVDCISSSSDARTKRSKSSNRKTSIWPTLSFTQSEQRKKKFNGNLKQSRAFPRAMITEETNMQNSVIKVINQAPVPALVSTRVLIACWQYGPKKKDRERRMSSSFERLFYSHVMYTGCSLNSTLP